MGVAASASSGANSNDAGLAELTSTYMSAVMANRSAVIAAFDETAARVAHGTHRTAPEIDLGHPGMKALCAAALQTDPRLATLLPQATAKGWTSLQLWADYFDEVRSRTAPNTGITGSSIGDFEPADDDDGDALLLYTGPEVFVYKVPPRASAAGHVAASWGLGEPLVENTFIRVTAVGDAVSVSLWQRGSRSRAAAPPTGFVPSLATAPALDGHALIAAGAISVAGGAQPIWSVCEPAVDSSRYFVLRITRSSGRGGRGAVAGAVGFVGFGFRHREEAFTFRASVEEYAAQRARQRNAVAASSAARPDNRGGDAVGARVDEHAETRADSVARLQGEGSDTAGAAAQSPPPLGTTPSQLAHELPRAAAQHPGSPLATAAHAVHRGATVGEALRRIAPPRAGGGAITGAPTSATARADVAPAAADTAAPRMSPDGGATLAGVDAASDDYDWGELVRATDNPTSAAPLIAAPDVTS